MKKLVLLSVAAFLLLTTAFSYAAVPHLINYQGKLTDASGSPLNGSYSITFRIYDSESSGSLLWQETQSGVVISKGIFSVLLGSVTSLNLAFDKQYYLAIQVGSDPEMSPRQKITSAGYAIRAENAEKVSGSENIFPSLGSVGIGTTNPGAKLEVAGDGTLRLAPRSSAPSSPQEGTIFYHSSDKTLYIYTGSGWKMFAIATFSTSYSDEKTYGCGGGCNLGTQVHYTWQNVNIPSSLSNLRVKYEWTSYNTGYDYYSHNIQVLVNGNAVESFTTYQTSWIQRDNTYNVSSYLRHDGTDTVKIQLTDTGGNEEDNYGFRNVYFEFK